MARKTALDISVYSLAAGDFLAVLKSFDFESESVVVDNGNVAQRYEVNQTVKAGHKFRASHMVDVGSNVKRSNLDVSVFTLGGVSYIGNLRSGTISVRTEVKEGSGVADLHKYPIAMITAVEFEATMLVDPSCVLAATGMTGTPAQRQVTVAITIGGMTFSMPMVLQTVGHATQRGELHEEKVKLVGRGTPSIAGSTLLASILTGSALVAYSVNTGGQTYSGNAIIEEASVKFEDAQLIEETYGFVVQGTPGT